MTGVGIVDDNEESLKDSVSILKVMGFGEIRGFRTPEETYYFIKEKE